MRLKTAVSVSSQRSAGRAFHTDGPPAEKACSANLVLNVA